MARNESDREDLMAEAVALVRRVELEFSKPVFTQAAAEHVVVGRRADGATSIYFAADPVYHLNSAGQLKRAFVDGFLYRTQGTTVARLDRQRGAETVLVRHDLSEEELACFRAAVAARLTKFCEMAPVARVLRVVAEESAEQLVEEIVNIVQSFLASGLPLAPPFPGKK